MSEASLQCELDRAWQQVRLLEDGWHEANRYKTMYEALRAILAASLPEGYDQQWFDQRMAQIIAEAR